MPSIRIDRFGGMLPKNKRGLGDSSLASLAVNTNLEHGSIRPWRYPSLELETDHKKICTIHKEECCWLFSENPCASFTRGDTDCNRIFSTGVMPWPAYAELPEGDSCCEVECEVEWCRLGVPQPTNPPTIIESDPIDEPADCECIDFGGTQKEREPRSYFYTFVNEWFEESTPSECTQPMDIDFDGNATLGFNIPPMTDGYCDPKYIRIYRGLPTPAVPDAVGQIEGRITAGNALEGDFDDFVSASYFLVAEIPYREGNFTHVDDIESDCLGEAYTSRVNQPPLECLEHIQMLENGSLVASYGKELWFSEPWRFHSWNCAMNLDDCIINFKVARSYIYVATDGYPYVIESFPFGDEECTCCRRVNKLLEPAPIVSGCSMVMTNSGVAWATNMGIMRLSGNEMSLVTHATMSESDWQEYLPHQIKAVFHQGRYFGFNRDKGFIFDFNDGIYDLMNIGENAKFSELNITPDAIFKSEGNVLYMSFGGDLYRWDAANTYMPFVWKSKLHIESGVRNYSIMKVVFEDWLRARKSPNPATVRLYADDKLYFERKVSSSRPFRIPKGIDALNFNIEVTGIEPINEIHMSTSKSELLNVNNA